MDPTPNTPVDPPNTPVNPVPEQPAKPAPASEQLPNTGETDLCLQHVGCDCSTWLAKEDEK